MYCQRRFERVITPPPFPLDTPPVFHSDPSIRVPRDFNVKTIFVRTVGVGRSTLNARFKKRRNAVFGKTRPDRKRVPKTRIFKTSPSRRGIEGRERGTKTRNRAVTVRNGSRHSIAPIAAVPVRKKTHQRFVPVLRERVVGDHFDGKRTRGAQVRRRTPNRYWRIARLEARQRIVAKTVEFATFLWNRNAIAIVSTRRTAHLHFSDKKQFFISRFFFGVLQNVTAFRERTVHRTVDFTFSKRHALVIAVRSPWSFVSPRDNSNTETLPISISLSAKITLQNRSYIVHALDKNYVK